MINDETVVTEEMLDVPDHTPSPTEETIETVTAEDNAVPDEASEAPSPDEKDELELLRTELGTLRQEIEEKKKVFERMSREIGEFSEIFPERSVSDIPDSVWESVKGGIPLAAAYALYERKNALRADTASRINERNGSISTGPVGRASTENFYTPDEVRKMTREEVKQNYSKILESMKKWN